MDTQPIVEETALVKPRSHKKKIEVKIPELNLPEKLFVLTIEDDSGSIPSAMKTKLRYALTGALFSELMLKNKIHLEDGRFLVNDPGPIDDPWLDEILSTIISDKKPRRIDHWLEAFGYKEIVQKFAVRLAERKVIKIEKKQYSWVIQCDLFPKFKASAKYCIKQSLRGIALAGETPEFSDIVLLNLLRNCQLLSLVFTRDERKFVFKNIKGMFQKELIAEDNAKLFADLKTLSAEAASFANGYRP